MLEYTGTSIVIEDISKELPCNPDRQWPKRTSPILSITDHHTGGSTKLKGKAAAINTADFCRSKDDPETPELEGHDWPGMAYTFFFPYEPEIREGKIIIYRCQPDNLRTYHAGIWNNESVSAGFQGNLSSNRSSLGNQPSCWQEIAWKEARGYFATRYNLDAFEFWPHAFRGKPSCPGRRIKSWLLDERKKDPTHIKSEAALHWVLSFLLDEKELTPRKNKPDDYALRRMIERFQRSQKIKDAHGKLHQALIIDGVFGPSTESFIRRALRARGIEMIDLEVLEVLS